MLLWMSLLGGLTIVTILMVVLIAAMFRAERRARRSLYRALDLSEDTVDLLMARNGDVRTELTLVRITPPAGVEAADEIADQDVPPVRDRPAIRLVHPAAEPEDSGADEANPARRRGA
jgi:hypothetical protein